MTAPRLALQHPIDVAREHGEDVAALVVAYRALQGRFDQLAALADELLDTTRETQADGLRIVCDIDDLLRAA